jgi:hypothetical protein
MEMKGKWMQFGAQIGFVTVIFARNLQNRWCNVCMCIHHCSSRMYMTKMVLGSESIYVRVFMINNGTALCRLKGLLKLKPFVSLALHKFARQKLKNE